jgi:apolipoprotein N-acyltransferase
VNLYKHFIGYLLSSHWKALLGLLFLGGLYPLAFAPIDIWPLSFISVLLPLVLLVENNQNQSSSSIANSSVISNFKIGFYWGVGCFGIGASWVYVSINEFGNAPWYLASFLTFLFVLLLASFKGIFAWLCGYLLQKSQTALLVFIAPSCWLVSEFIQSTIFNGFPWLLTGYSQIESPLVGLLSWLGVYGVSWFVIAMASIFVLLILPSQAIKKTYWFALMGLVSVILLAMIDYNSKEKDTDNLVKLNIGLVQPNIPQEKKWDRSYFQSIIQILNDESEALWGADLIVWPEGAIPAYAQQVSFITDEITRKAKQTKSHVILGIPDYDEEKKLSFTTFKAYGENYQNYQKQILVPFGEYVPLQNLLRGLIDFFDLPMSDFSPAITEQKPFEFERYSLIPAICYEIVYPSIIRDLSIKAAKKSKPQLIATISNDAWFGDSLGPYQHMQMARTRTIELGMPLIRSTNDGITAFVDYKGNIIKQLPRYQQDNLQATIALHNRETLFRQYGFIGVFILLAVSFVFILLSVWGNLRR